MTQILQITNGTTTLNLLSGALQLEDAGWFTDTGGSGAVLETFRMSSDDTDANIRAFLADFDELMEQAENYRNDATESVAVWLKVQSEGESAARQALIYFGSHTEDTSEFDSPLLGTGTAQVVLYVHRHRLWEATSADSDSESTVNSLGGSYVLGHGAMGTAPGRISLFRVISSEVTTHNKVWVGIKPTGLGTTGFNAVWEAEDGTNYTDASDSADATASGGSKVTISYATGAGLNKRFTLRLSNVAAGNYTSFIGQYLVLGRVKLSSATTKVYIQLNSGWAGANDGPLVGDTFLDATVDSNLTNWNLIELGVCNIPQSGNRAATFSSTVQDHFFQVFSSRESASGSLDFDCFVLIPAKHLYKAEGATITTGTNNLTHYTFPDDSQVSVGVATGINTNVAGMPSAGWVYPIDGGLLIYASQPDSQHVLGDEVAISTQVYARYKSYIG